jgi:ubiquinone biosynthesis protein
MKADESVALTARPEQDANAPGAGEQLRLPAGGTRKVENSVVAGLNRYFDRAKEQVAQEGAGAEAAPVSALPMPGVIAPMPRRSFVERAAPKRLKKKSASDLTFKVGRLRTLSRLFVWILGALRMLLGNFVDILLRRDTIDRRAVRLRLVLQGMGPTFIKLGQQLSIRADILPFRYCNELTKMLDKVPPFPVAVAIERIEKVAGRPIQEIFRVFDPVPIGSASIGCVYQAILPTGEKVAVKVRRPGIGETFAADLRALGWLMDIGEQLTILRPGMTRDLRLELKKMLFEELNYPLEARYTDLFSRRAKKKKQDYIGAPKVYFDISGEDVLVTEFVSGVFLWEILGAIDRRDDAALAALKAQGFDPKVIAKRMIRAFYWETLENIFFHADPHPANIVVQPDNSLVFIDFGSCGRFSGKGKRRYHRFQQYISAEDISGMTEAAMSMLEPLPPVDLERLTREIEAFFWDWVYATESKHAQWWERCTGQMWMKFLGIARRYAIPINLDTLRMFRATFLYDSIAMRLHNDLDMNSEFKDYVRERGLRARKTVRRALRSRLDRGPTNRDYLVIEDLARLSRQFANRVQHALDSPPHRFFDMLGKAAYGVSMILRLLILASGLHIVAVLCIGVVTWLRHRPVDPSGILWTMVSTPAYQIVVTLFILIALRKALVRFDELDVAKK